MKNNSVGKVLELFIAKASKLNVNELSLDTSGVIDSKFYGKNIQRSVLLASIDSYTLLRENNINIDYGQLGENILTDFNPYDLEIGTQLKIGEVVLEISQQCTLCKSLENLEQSIPKLLKDSRGIFAKVIKSGKIRKEDALYIL